MRHRPTSCARTLRCALIIRRTPADAHLTAQVEGALHTLEQRRLERRQRELRSQIAEADRRGDQEMLQRLMLEKIEADRMLRDC